jgi:hypothetical protein
MFRGRKGKGPGGVVQGGRVIYLEINFQKFIDVLL